MYEYMTFDEQLEKLKIHGRVLETLEFVKIREKIISKARTSYGRKLCEDMLPCTEKNYVRTGLDWTSQAMEHIGRFGVIPLGGIRYMDEALAYASSGGTLSCIQLLDCASFFRSSKEIKNALARARQAGSPFVDETEPLIAQAIDALETDDKLQSAIEEAILGDNEVSDKASRALADIRREKKSVAAGIRTLLERVIANNGDMLQEAIITLREGRYCIPVKADFKGRVEGLVHGASATGQTLFLEPMSVVDANNRISELQAMEEAEIERILGAFTAEVLASEDKIRNNAQIAAALDFAFAKAEYGREMNCTCPVLNDDGQVILRKARHPLIAPDVVVPIDIEVGRDYSTLIITGPNTGGKTVSLKTCGLLTMMTMAGMAIPAGDGSSVCVFDRVLADIGDEQSIEQSLSTFSAHISNIVFILKNIRGKALVLLDELGSGTDPAEGAALAIAIIEALRNKGCVTMATTHYKELKSYATGTEDVMNASCEFDTETLAPTYRLIIGRPGSSNAFVISRKLGIPAAILEDARSHLSSDEISYEELLTRAENDSRKAAEILEQNEKLRIELDSMKKELEQEQAKIKSSRNKILNEARQEQKEYLEEREEEVDAMLKEFRKKSKRMDREETEAELNKIRRKLRAGIKDLEEDGDDEELESRVALSGEPVKQVIPGESYYIPEFDVTGVAMAEPSKSGSVRIAAGAMKINVKVSQLRMPTQEQRNESDRKKGASVTSGRKPSNMAKTRLKAATDIRSELMLIGMTTAEAESALSRYLEDCRLSGIKNARIVHGKGTGALRSCVRDVLDKDDNVRSYRDGIQGEGDSGVTIVTFNN